MHEQHAVKDTSTFDVEEGEDATVPFIFDFIQEIIEDGSKLHEVYLGVVFCACHFQIEDSAEDVAGEAEQLLEVLTKAGFGYLIQGQVLGLSFSPFG